MPRPTTHLLLSLAIAVTLAACNASDPAPTSGAPPTSSDASSTPTSGASAPHAAPAPAQPSRIEVTEFATGLKNPWALAFLPDGRMLVSERHGTLRFIAPDGTLSEPIRGVPAVSTEGQGGLLDIALSPDFATDNRVYFTFAEAGDNGMAGTVAASGKLVGDTLHEVKVFFRQEPKLASGIHYGSRIVFDGQGHLYIALGENNQRPTSQMLDHLQGKIVRLRLDGSIPRDNPFVGRDNARAEIWSYGHRNQQGAALDPRTGKLWTNEHGPRGGDEINIPEAGKNYGWPLATYGINYSGQPIPEASGTTAPDTEQPYYYWERSPGVSGMAFYTSPRFPAWKDSLFIGALAQRELIRQQLDGDTIVAEERLLSDRKERIRDVRQGPDGYLYALTDEPVGKVLRIGLANGG